jgi:hypothetical protein
MTQYDYEYSGLMAQFWDLLRGDTSRQEHIVRLCQKAGFVTVHVTSGLSFEQAAAIDTLFCLLGTRPASHA